MRHELLLLVLTGCSLDLGTTTDQATSPAVVSLTFDDTFAEQYQVGSLLAARSMHATFFVDSPRIGTSGYMTQDQLNALRDAGNEIAGHTLTHPHLPALDSDPARREVCDDRVALLNRGFAVSSFAYPFGDDTAGIHRIAALCGYNSARDVGGLVAGTSCSSCPYTNPIPPQDLYMVRTPGSVRDTTTLDDLETYVTQAENHGGGWVPLVFHHICDSCSTYSISLTTLTAFLDWLAARSTTTGTVVETADEVIGGSVLPGVAGPPAPPPLPSANLIQNPSLELDANGDQVPDCWQRGGFGTNTATYALTSAAHDGAVAQQITITSYSTGARRLVTRQDSGACAPAATPGHSYLVTGWYLATTPPRYTIYYRNTAGSWAWFAQSSQFPVSASYVEASYTTPALPSDATAISIGLSIFAAGSITVDDFTMTDTNASTVTDTTPPSVAITSPADGASVSGTVTISATASDNVGVDHVDFRVDDNLENWADTAPYSITWNTRFVHGSHVLTARAFDAAGNATTSAPITVTLP